MASFIARALGIGVIPTTGVLEGFVVDQDTGDPIVGITVAAQRTPHTIGVDDFAEAWTDSDGSFQMTDLAIGDWVIKSGNGVQLDFSVWAFEYYDNKLDEASADRVKVNGVIPTTVTVRLTVGGTISGTVTDEISGLPIEGVGISHVIMHKKGTLEGAFGDPATTASGTYLIEGLHEASYKVCFSHPDYELECWDDAKDFGGGIGGTPGDWIPATAGEAVTGIDAELTPEP